MIEFKHMQEKYKCHCGKIIGKKGGRYEYVKHFIGCGQFLELWGKEYTLMRKIVGKLRSGYNVEELKKWLRKYFIEVTLFWLTGKRCSGSSRKNP